MKKQSTYYLLLLSFVVSLLSTNVYASQLNSALGRILNKKELFEGDFCGFASLDVFKVDEIKPSHHFPYKEASVEFIEHVSRNTIGIQPSSRREDYIPEVKKRNLLNQYFSSFLSDPVQHN